MDRVKTYRRSGISVKYLEQIVSGFSRAGFYVSRGAAAVPADGPPSVHRRRDRRRWRERMRRGLPELEPNRCQRTTSARPSAMGGLYDVVNHYLTP